MPANAYSLRAHAIESLTRVNRPTVPRRVAVRNAAAVILPLAVGLAAGHPRIGLAVGTGALTAMFSDQPGPYRQRVRQLLLNALAAGLASLVGFSIGGQLLPLLLITAAFGFFGGLLVVFGPDTARAGMTSMILLVTTAATPMAPTAALGSAALIFGGGLLLALFSLAAWPLQRYWPERHALVEVYRGLAELVQESGREETDVPALSEAMTNLQQTLLGRHRAHGRAMETFGVLLELAERIRLELTAITELHADPTIHADFRRAAAGVLTAIADALAHGDSPAQATTLLQAMRAKESTIPATATHQHALLGQLGAAVRNADWAGARGELRESAEEQHLPSTLRSTSIAATLRASLTPRSVAFRHAVRMAVCLSTAMALSRLLNLPHGYWLPMTAAIVLRADFAATFSFGLLRVLGTVLGLVVTTLLLYLSPDQPWAHLLLMAALCMAFRYLAGAHYGIAVAALTGTVVILLSFAGVPSGAAVIDRVINTALGAGIALLAYVAWPTWERSQARDALATMLDAYADYLRALAGSTGNDCSEIRTAARRARINAQASIERMRNEPATPPPLLALARKLLANGNRLARTAMTTEAMLGDLTALPVEAGFKAYVLESAATLQVISAALRRHEATPALPNLRQLQRTLMNEVPAPAEAATIALLARITDRLADNVDTLAHIVNQAQPESTHAAGVSSA
ncbi:MAG TPA: FUSC family protein [Rhodanobacter sp.]|jgi:uncharacterized membrane protein YccC|nr:FUSC family protein [Rhodanobacter sp.]